MHKHLTHTLTHTLRYVNSNIHTVDALISCSFSCVMLSLLVLVIYPPWFLPLYIFPHLPHLPLLLSALNCCCPGCCMYSVWWGLDKCLGNIGKFVLYVSKYASPSRRSNRFYLVFHVFRRTHRVDLLVQNTERKGQESRMYLMDRGVGRWNKGQTLGCTEISGEEREEGSFSDGWQVIKRREKVRETGWVGAKECVREKAVCCLSVPWSCAAGERADLLGKKKDTQEDGINNRTCKHQIEQIKLEHKHVSDRR